MMNRRLLLTCVALVSLLSAIGVVAQKPKPITPSEECFLEGFGLEKLAEPSFWSVTLDNNNCLIPANYGENNVTKCVVHFSVCDPIPSAQCRGHTNSSTCQEVTTNDGQMHYFDIGTYRGNGGYAPLGGDSVGFATIRQGETVESRLCNSTFETTLTWSCKETAVWNPSSNDASQFVKTVTKGLSDCTLEIEFDYSGACYVAPTLSPDTCQLPPYDTTDLTTQDYWYTIAPPSVCYNTETLECRIYFAFCQALPLSLASNCYGAAVCQIGTNSEGENYAYNMGSFKNYTHFIPNDQVVDGGFHMDVENGTIPDDGQCNNIGGLHTRVVLVCNASAKWTEQQLSAVVRVIHIGTDPCYYEIEVPYSGACIPIGPEVGGATPSPVGWILIGIFFFVVIVYFLVGTGFQFFVKGARGLEMIPNYEFWAQFFFLVLEGCKFSLDVITCFQCDGQIKPSIVASGRGGVDYDKI